MPQTKARRRLGDLYIRGKIVEVDDGSGDPVPVWIQKLNEIDRDAVLRRATSAKARYRLDFQHDESELFVSTLSSVTEFLGRDDMIAIVIAEDLTKARERIESQMVHDEDGWGKDNKIQDLIDAWTGTDESPGLAATWAEDNNDSDALKVKEEIEAFEAEQQKLLEQERDRLVREWEHALDADVARAAAREVLNRRADEEFIREWGRQQLFYCVRDPDDHGKRYFATLAEIDDLDDKVRSILDRHTNELFVNLKEGKDSPAKPASSSSSEPQVAEVRSNLSGLEVVNE